MFSAATTAMSNSTLSEEASLSSFNPLILQNTNIITPPQQQPATPKKVKKRRSLPGNPDPDAEVIALSPKSLLATNRFICEICNKGFQRDQNLQLHRRGHNLPWKLKQRSNKDVVRKKAYVCPEPTCVHHHPSRALGDLTGIKKHFCRKHGEKKYKCEKCSKIYAVQSDWKAHSKTCGTREYRCDCGTLFSRKDSFITHRAFCDALAEESARLSTNPFTNPILPPPPPPPQQQPPSPFSHLLPTSQNPNSSLLFPFSSWDQITPQNPNHNPLMHIKTENHHFSPPPPPQLFQPPPPNPFKGLLTTSPFDTTGATSAHFLSATALLQKAATMGALTTATIQQQSQPNQGGQALNNMTSFDELGSSFRSGGAEGLMVGPPPPQQVPSSITTTTATPDHQHQQQQQQLQQQNHDHHYSTMLGLANLATWRKNDEGFTRDFLGLTAGDHYGNNNGPNVSTRGGGGGGGGGGFGDDVVDDDGVGDMLKFTGGLQYRVTAAYDGDNSSLLLKPHHHHHDHDHHQVESFGFVAAESPATAGSETRWG